MWENFRGQEIQGEDSQHIPQRLRRITEESLVSITTDNSTDQENDENNCHMVSLNGCGQGGPTSRKRVFWEEHYSALLPVCLMLNLYDLCQFWKSMELEDCQRSITCLEHTLKSMRLHQVGRFYSLKVKTSRRGLAMLTPPSQALSQVSSIQFTNEEGQLFALWLIYERGVRHPTIHSMLDRKMPLKLTKMQKTNEYSRSRKKHNEMFLPDLLYLLERNGDDNTILGALKSQYNTKDLDLSMAVTFDGVTLLHLAVQKRRTRVLEALIKTGRVDTNVTCDSLGRDTTPLHLASHHDSYECCRMLLDDCADVNFSRANFPPIHYAANKRRSRCMPLLLERGANINHPTDTAKFSSIVDRSMYWSRITDKPPGISILRGENRNLIMLGTISGLFSSIVSAFNRRILGKGTHRDYEFLSIEDFQSFIRREIKILEKQDAAFPEFSDKDREVPLTLETLVKHGGLPFCLRHLR